ncbi:MAG: flagellar motor switch protein FliN [Geminicoccaceae bacterium]|nr:flagellar motor switch protein FliN [Geminicoccaceae bacterium]
MSENETIVEPDAGAQETTAAGAPPERATAVYDVPVRLSAVLGRASMPVGRLLRLGRGAVVELDRKVGEPVDVYVNDRLVARGEVVVVDDRLAVTLTELVRSEP